MPLIHQASPEWAAVGLILRLVESSLGWGLRGQSVSGGGLSRVTTSPPVKLREQSPPSPPWAGLCISRLHGLRIK